MICDVVLPLHRLPAQGKNVVQGEKFITVIFRAKQVYRATVSIHVGAATRRLFAMSSAVILL
jgi:hypothetical protein